MVARLISSEITAMAWSACLAAQVQMPAATPSPAETAPPWCQPMAADLKQSQANEGRFPAQQGWTAAGACLGSQ
jgi:hypothetical protein